MKAILAAHWVVLPLMVLEVSFEDFLAEHTSLLPSAPVYVAPTRSGCQVTAADPKINFILYARTSKLEPAVAKTLTSAGKQVRKGAWIGEEALAIHGNMFDCHVAGVAYRSEGAQPGLWMEAFDNEPTSFDVLKRFYDEFKQGGFVGNLEMDAFCEAAEATVVILKPETIRQMAERTAAIID